MANNYSESCFMIPFGPDEAAAVADWKQQYVEEVERLRTAYEEDDDCDEETKELFHDRALGFEFFIQREDDDGRIVCSGDGEYFNVTAAIYWVQRLLQATGSSKGVFFSWASWCDKGRPGEFDGGACVVTKDSEMTWFAADLLTEASEAGIEIGNL